MSSSCSSSSSRSDMISCYLLRSDSQMYRGSTYIGFTTDPRRRIRQHNGLLVNGARQTKRKRPWTMVVVVHGFPNKTSGLQFEWAWQHPRRSRYVKEIYRTKRPPPGVKGKLQILHEMLNLLPWKNYPLHIHYTSEDISLLGEKCCSKKPPIHIDSVWGSLDDLPLYQSTEYKEVDTDDSSHEEEEPRGMMITEYNDDSSRNGDSSCSSSTIRTGTRRKKNNNNNNKRRNLNGYRNECNIIYECSSKERSEDMMMMMAIEQDRYEVTEKEKQRKKKRGRSPLSSSLNNMKIGDHNDDIENVDIEGVMNGDQYVTFKGNNNFRCFLCNDVDNKSSSSSSSSCVRSSESSSNSSRNKMKLFECFYCNSRMHIVCLARRFRMQLEEEAGGAAAPIIPQKGHCPSCKKTMLWPTVVENARITRKRKEVVKKKKQRKQLLQSRRGRDSSSSSMIMTSSSHDYSALPLTQLSPQPDDDADDDDHDDLQHCEKKKKKKKKKKKFNLEECIHNDMNSGSCSSSNEKEEGQEDDGQIKNSAPSSSSSSSRLMSVGRGKQLVMGSGSRQPKAAVTVEQLYDEIDSDCGREGKKRNSKDATISTTTSSSISSTLNILGCSARYQQQQQQQHESRERVDDYHPVVVAINDDDDDDDDDDDEKEKGVGLVESNHGAAEEEGDENRDIDSRNSTLERQGASSGPKLQNQDDLAVEDSLASRISKRYNVVLI